MNPKIFLIKESEVRDNDALLHKLQDDNDILIVHPDSYTKEQLDMAVAAAKNKFFNLSDEARVRLVACEVKPKPVAIKPQPEGERKKRKRIMR